MLVFPSFSNSLACEQLVLFSFHIYIFLFFYFIYYFFLIILYFHLKCLESIFGFINDFSYFFEQLSLWRRLASLSTPNSKISKIRSFPGQIRCWTRWWFACSTRSPGSTSASTGREKSKQWWVQTQLCSCSCRSYCRCYYGTVTVLQIRYLKLGLQGQSWEWLY